MLGAGADQTLLGLSGAWAHQPAPVGANGATPSNNQAVGGTPVPGVVAGPQASNGQVLTAWGAIVVFLVVAYLFFTPVDLG